MKTRKELIIIASLLIVINCCQSYYLNAQNTGLTVDGLVTGLPDNTLVYLYDIQLQKLYDSTRSKNNQFSLKGPLLKEPKIIFLFVHPNSKKIYTSFIAGNDQVTVKGDLEDFPWEVEIDGSETAIVEKYLKLEIKDLHKKRDSLLADFFKLSYLERDSDLGKDAKEKLKQMDSIILQKRIKFTKEYLNSYRAVLELAAIKSNIPKDTLQGLYNRLSTELKNSSYGQTINNYLDKGIVKVGDTYRDIIGINQLGDTVQLSELPSKYTLLDFGAAYCAPCAQSADELREIDTDFKKVVTILSVSADLSKEVWLQSLTRDNATWMSLWDGKGTNGGACLLYSATQLPTYFLIDPTGKVIDKWIGYQKGSLKKKLKQFKII